MRLAALVIAALLAFPLAAQSPALKPGETVTIGAQGARLWNRRVFDPVFRTLGPGSQVKLISPSSNEAGNWWYVDTGVEKAWVHESEMAGIAVVAPAQPASETPAPVVAPAPAASADPLAAQQALWDERRQELAGFVRMLQSGDPPTLSQACQSLPYTGISDSQVFDLIEQRLVAQYEESQKVRQPATEEAAWCLRALASSGNARYLPTIRKVESAPKGTVVRSPRGYGVRNAVTQIALFANWNYVITSERWHRSGQPWEFTRMVNILRADDPALQREGVRRVAGLRARFPTLDDVVEQQLLAEALVPVPDRQKEDALAWFAKTLAESGNPKYQAALAQVARDSPSEKIRDHAESALEKLGGEL